MSSQFQENMRIVEGRGVWTGDSTRARFRGGDGEGEFSEEDGSVFNRSMCVTRICSGQINTEEAKFPSSSDLIHN